MFSVRVSGTSSRNQPGLLRGLNERKYLKCPVERDSGCILAGWERKSLSLSECQYLQLCNGAMISAWYKVMVLVTLAVTEKCLAWARPLIDDYFNLSHILPIDH